MADDIAGLALAERALREAALAQLCVCGHPSGDHGGGTGECFRSIREHGEDDRRCTCQQFDKRVAIGVKADAGKRLWHLLPIDGIGPVIDVLMFGAKKYAPDNWRKVPGWRERYYDAALRHLTAWQQGDRYDPESGLPHLAHACCCVTFMIALEAAEAANPPPVK